MPFNLNAECLPHVAADRESKRRCRSIFREELSVSSGSQNNLVSHPPLEQPLMEEVVYRSQCISEDLDLSKNQVSQVSQPFTTTASPEPKVSLDPKMIPPVHARVISDDGKEPASSLSSSVSLAVQSSGSDLPDDSEEDLRGFKRRRRSNSGTVSSSFFSSAVDSSLTVSFMIGNITQVDANRYMIVKHILDMSMVSIQFNIRREKRKHFHSSPIKEIWARIWSNSDPIKAWFRVSRLRFLD